MNATTREMLYTLLVSRIDNAFARTKENREYLTACEQQNRAQEAIDKLFDRFSDDEKQMIEQHDEGETHKRTFELREIYLQGLRDGFKIIALLGDFQSGVTQL